MAAEATDELAMAAEAADEQAMDDDEEEAIVKLEAAAAAGDAMTANEEGLALYVVCPCHGRLHPSELPLLLLLRDLNMSEHLRSVRLRARPVSLPAALRHRKRCGRCPPCSECQILQEMWALPTLFRVSDPAEPENINMYLSTNIHPGCADGTTEAVVPPSYTQTTGQ
jgi:hypothetical protein